ncbi:MAG: sigma-70 family RNA polymerase sigma factor [Planctomycetota bacterium]
MDRIEAGGDDGGRSADLRASAELLRSSRDGDERALQELVLRHYHRLRAFIRLRVDARTRQRESASDITQSVCLEVLRNAGRFEYQGEAAFRSWLFTAALRKLRDRRDFHGAIKRDPGLEVPVDAGDGADGLAGVYRTSLDPEGAAQQAEFAEILEKAFDHLSDREREALTLRSIAELPYDAIGAEMDSTPESARKLVQRARARLADVMARVEGP